MDLDELENVITLALEASDEGVLNDLLKEALHHKSAKKNVGIYPAWEAAWKSLETKRIIRFHLDYNINARYSLFGHAVHNVFAEKASEEQKLQAISLLVKSKKNTERHVGQKRTMKSKPALVPAKPISQAAVESDDNIGTRRSFQDAAGGAKASREVNVTVAEMEKRAVTEAFMLRAEVKKRKNLSAVAADKKPVDAFVRIEKKFGAKIKKALVNILAETAIQAAYSNLGHRNIINEVDGTIKTLIRNAPEKQNERSSGLTKADLKHIYKIITQRGKQRTYIAALSQHMNKEQRDLFFRLTTQLGQRAAYMGKEDILDMSEYRVFLAEQFAEQKRINKKRSQYQMPRHGQLYVPYACAKYDPERDKSVLSTWQVIPFISL